MWQASGADHERHRVNEHVQFAAIDRCGVLVETQVLNNHI